MSERYFPYNAAVTGWTIGLLQLQEEQKVCEVGFGRGDGLHIIREQYPSIKLAGVEPSPLMLRKARKRFGDSIHLEEGSTAELPFPDETLDALYAVHVLYFLEDPLTDLHETLRVLKSGGTLALTIEEKHSNAKYAVTQTGSFTLYEAEDAASLLEQAGYEDTVIHRKDLRGADMACIMGRKASTIS